MSERRSKAGDTPQVRALVHRKQKNGALIMLFMPAPLNGYWNDGFDDFVY